MFPNQIQFGKDIAQALTSDIFTILAVALTQSGKTGSMLSLIQQFPHDHVFLITGLSSVEWMEQTTQLIRSKEGQISVVLLCICLFYA